MVTDATGKRLFFQLLHTARRMKGYSCAPEVKDAYLNGMWQVMRDNREDFRIADNQRDVWANQNSGAE